MLKKFSVENFKSFRNKMVFDLSKPGNYAFGKECIKDGIVSKGAIYGRSGIGKSNLGRALFDIVNHLTDKSKEPAKYQPFINLSSQKPFATFEYEFLFGNHILVYKYTKKNVNDLLEESLSIDGIEMIFYDFRDETGFSAFKGSETLTLTGTSKISRVKFIMNSSVLVDDDEMNVVLKQFQDFVDRMLLFYSIRENGFIGFSEAPGHVDSIIINAGKVADFETFLNQFGLNLKLTVIETPEGKTLYLVYEHGMVNYFTAASSGMISLILFYSWLIVLEKCSFVFIDEFDAFYHYELSEQIIEMLKKYENVQIFVSTHNTDLLNNNILRPDCYFVLNEEKIDSLNHLYDKDLRQKNNIQKMFKSGEFEK